MIDQEAMEMLTRERAQLAQQVLTFEQIIAQRSSMLVNELIDGLLYLGKAADAGNADAQRVLKLLTEQLDQARARAARIQIVRPNGGPPG